MGSIRKFFLNRKIKRLHKQANAWQRKADKWHDMAEQVLIQWRRIKNQPDHPAYKPAEKLFLQALTHAERTGRYAEHFRERIKTLEMIK